MPNWPRFFSALFAGEPWAIRAMLSWLAVMTIMFITAKLII